MTRRGLWAQWLRSSLHASRSAPSGARKLSRMTSVPPTIKKTISVEARVS
ncbi:hypothetical protein RHAL1_02454 [Beijerinckiaceae bacterium RH AL1]|nr:hypothetical protein RHAL1_02454 [Beijerinckiaceae bacterium RH AL1]